MKLKRHSSKRVPLARKYNLEKKVKAHNKKLKKHANSLKKSGVLAQKKRGATAASISIPNAWPHKRELLAELQQKKEAAIQEKLEARRRKKAGIPEPVSSIDTPVASYEQMMAQSAERARQFEVRNNGTAALEESIQKNESSEIAQTRKKFYEDLVKVTNTADVVLVVLDARDPEACRSEKLETDIRANGKRLVFLLNKIDLVPAEAVEAWLAFYRKIAPTIAFKACLTGAGKAARKNPLTMGPIRGNEEIYQSSSANFGADKLIQLLKQYSRIGLGTGSLTVGIVGYPNVGKSSIINTLMGLRRGTGSSNNGGHVKTGNHAGVTSQLQEVQLDNKITLIDSAGVVFPSSIGSNDASLVLRRAINVDSLRDPVGTVGRLLNHRGVTVEGICQILRVPTFNNAQELIRNVSQTHGKVKRGGGADMEASAKFILNRVSDGKSHFYTMPPASQGPSGGFAFVVNDFKPEFDVNALEDENMNE
jgi:nuclear GTP-binding protein